MTRRGDRTHAWLARPKGAPGEPSLPQVGELYLVDTTIYSFRHDPAADRPAVVICVPPDRTSRGAIHIVTRTTKPAKGVRHPADRSVGCDQDGTFSDLVSVEQQLWTPQNVEKLGVLPDPYLSAVLERFS
jgi:hypothetical protein